ncbi:hypothetical protein Ocin01_17909 [Orchesella cincta]|uniref:F-box domain-containing protein n=1 Tax=Orchesella cincta TaxID=48709 RepID=A0A1D2M774_ORCCI|nr:hypothetical protein Ocin01_17909 [Orchesella cincta]
MNSEVLPFLMRYMIPTEHLECRKVSRDWKDAVDLVYQTGPLQMDIPVPFGRDPHPWHVLASASPASSLPTIFSTPEQVHEFLRAMESHPGNPFPGRNLLLCPTSDEFEDHLVFWAGVTRVLERFGNHVHVFRVDFRPEWEYKIVELRHQRIFQRCLTHLPNLRSLAVTIQSEASPNREDLAYLTENALPQLPQLETLMVSCISAEFTALILASCCVPHKIRRLFLGEFRSSERGYYDEVLGFQNLEVICDGFHLPELERFSNRAQVPPLAEIWLYGQSRDDQSVFTLLERFGSTLKKLGVNGYPLGLRMNAGYDFRVNLPQLKSLILLQYLGPT